MKSILSHYKSAKKRSENKDNSTKKKSSRSTRNNGAGPSTSHANHHSGDSDDDDDGPYNNGRMNGRPRRSHAQSNGVSSSSNLRDSQPAASKRLRPQRYKSTEADSETSESSSDESSNSDESSGIPLADLGRAPRTGNKMHKLKTKKKRGAVSSSSPKKNPRALKRRKNNSEEEQENVEPESCDKSRSSSENKSSRRSNRKVTRPIQSSSDEDDENGKHPNDDKQKRGNRRPKRYESDQSFHVDGPRKKTADSDSDKPRATRESAKKKFIEWALTSGEEDDDDEDFEQKPQTSSQASRAVARATSRRKKAIQSESEHSDSKSSKPIPSRRSTRTMRVSQSQSQSQHDDSESDEEEEKPTTSTNVRSSRLNGSSQLPISAPSRTTRSSQNPPNSRSSNDHNYGEPGPSSAANIAPRETRSTILSRHQRNPDELDQSALEEGSIASTSQNNRLLRLRSANLRAAPTLTSNFEALNGIRRTTRNRIQLHDYFEADNENEPEDTSSRFQPSHQNQRTRPTRPEPRADPTDDSDSFSDEDKTPLKQMAASSSKKAHEHNTRRGSAVDRVKKNLYSEDEQVC